MTLYLDTHLRTYLNKRHSDT